MDYVIVYAGTKNSSKGVGVDVSFMAASKVGLVLKNCIRAPGPPPIVVHHP